MNSTCILLYMYILCVCWTLAQSFVFFLHVEPKIAHVNHTNHINDLHSPKMDEASTPNPWNPWKSYRTC